LALAQTRKVVHALSQAHRNVHFRIETVRTRGDVVTDRPVAAIGTTGVFTRELELALLESRIDLAVHSLKDLPTEPAAGLWLAPAVPLREDPRDVLVTHDGSGLRGLPLGARVGTSSLRRRAQLAAIRDDLRLDDIRGNIDTRLGKVRDGEYDAVVLARAGLARAGLLTAEMEVLDIQTMLPAPGQGALALEIRRDDEYIKQLVGAIDHPPSRHAVVAERALLRHLAGGCQAPIAALGQCDGAASLTLVALVARPDGQRAVRGRLRGPVSEAEALGQRLAGRLLADGASEIIEQCRAE